MDIESGIRAAKWSADTVIDLVLAPVRLARYFLRVAAQRRAEYEQRQAWNRHVRGTYLDPESREDPFFYDPRTQH